MKSEKPAPLAWDKARRRSANDCKVVVESVLTGSVGTWAFMQLWQQLDNRVQAIELLAVPIFENIEPEQHPLADMVRHFRRESNRRLLEPVKPRPEFPRNLAAQALGIILDGASHGCLRQRQTINFSDRGADE